MKDVASNTYEQVAKVSCSHNQTKHRTASTEVKPKTNRSEMILVIRWLDPDFVANPGEE